MNQTKFLSGKAHFDSTRFNNPAHDDKSGSIIVGDDEWFVAEVCGDCFEHKGNASLIVAAFNSATQAQDMGFDGIKAIEALPKLLEACKTVLIDVQRAKRLVPDLHLFTYGEVSSDKLLESALAQAGQKPRGKDYDTPEGA